MANVVVGFNSDSKVWFAGTVENSVAFESKQAAINFAGALARDTGVGVTIQKKDGSIQLEVTKVRGARKAVVTVSGAADVEGLFSVLDVADVAGDIGVLNADEVAEQDARDRKNARRRAQRAAAKVETLASYEADGNLDASL